MSVKLGEKAANQNITKTRIQRKSRVLFASTMLLFQAVSNIKLKQTHATRTHNKDIYDRTSTNTTCLLEKVIFYGVANMFTNIYTFYTCMSNTLPVNTIALLN